MNHLTLTGHLGRNALLRTVTLPKGPRDVLNFSLAVRTGWGEAERTIWYDCSLWGDRAAKLAPYLLKGTRVLLSGSPDVRLFQKQDGTTSAALTVAVDDVEFIGDKPKPAEPAPASEPASSTAPEPDDVPF